MSHIETLIMNEVEKALENLQRSGVGFITDKTNKTLYYDIDRTVITVEVGTEGKEE